MEKTDLDEFASMFASKLKIVVDSQKDRRSDRVKRREANESDVTEDSEEEANLD
jgi:hypothetical protein